MIFKTIEKFAIISIAVMCSGQAPPQSPLVRAFGDNEYWIVAEDMKWVIGNTQTEIKVPKGFVTDFASIPKALWSFGLSPHGNYSRAAVVHDYLYWTQKCTRDQADRLLVIAMKESGVGGFDEFVIYQGVNRAGGSPWKDNAKEAAAGLPRFVPEKYLQPADPNVKWAPYRAMLVKVGVVDPKLTQDPTYCAYGNDTKVP